jgi:hypothetical protein
MKSPKHLSHKPIVSVNDYASTDGIYHKGTDVVALSVGRAQWNSSQFSAKVWRYNDAHGRWSRQSEELPLHRVFDLCILTVATLLTDPEAHFSVSNLKEVVDQPDGVIEIQEFYTKNRKHFEPRIKQLKQLLTDLEAQNKSSYR